MIINILKLCAAGLMPALAAIILWWFEQKSIDKKTSYIARQIIIGIIFGLIAILGTELGVPVNGAQVNTRDAAPIVAGLFFGGPAGIIAGVIGGVERWFAVFWGVGAYTRVACSVSTVLAGIFSALLRKYMFENKRPNWLMTLFCGVTMEVIHLAMVFVTNVDNAQKAIGVIKGCTIPLIVINSLSVVIASIALTLVSKSRKAEITKYKQKPIFVTVQRFLIITILSAYVVASIFMIVLESNLAYSKTETELRIAVQEVANGIEEASDANLLNITRLVAKDIESSNYTTEELARKYNLSTVNIIDKNGIIQDSNEKEFIGFDMNSGEQAGEFMCLVNGTEQFVQPFQPISFDTSQSRKFAGVATEYGFIQTGYDSDVFQKQIRTQVELIANNRHVGETGVVVVFDDKGNVITQSAHFDEEKLAEYRKTHKAPLTEGSVQTISAGDEDYYYYYYSAEGYRIIALDSVENANMTGTISIYVMVFDLILIFAVLFILIYMLIKNKIVNRIVEMTQALNRITSGDLSEKVNVRSNMEFASLSDDINSTVDALKGYIKEAEARIDKELELARAIQVSALPSHFPAFPTRNDFEIFARMDTAKEVGGDFYDFYMTDENQLNFAIADVSGKGIPAAMFMMRAKSVLRSQTEQGLPIDEVFINSNNSLCNGNDADMFVTAWQGMVDLSNGIMGFANAGHNPPIIRHQNGSFEYYKSRSNLVLASMEDISYKKNVLELSYGDIVYLYTDGVTEAENSANELYGSQRLLDVLNSREFSSMEDLCLAVKADIDSFVGDAPQFDDITMVAFRYYGKDKD